MSHGRNPIQAIDRMLCTPGHSGLANGLTFSRKPREKAV
jgi:hypothetical protein